MRQINSYRACISIEEERLIFRRLRAARGLIPMKETTEKATRRKNFVGRRSGSDSRTPLALALPLAPSLSLDWNTIEMHLCVLNNLWASLVGPKCTNWTNFQMSCSRVIESPSPFAARMPNRMNLFTDDLKMSDICIGAPNVVVSIATACAHSCVYVRMCAGVCFYKLMLSFN